MSLVESLADVKPRDQFNRFTRTPGQVEKDHEAASLKTQGLKLREIGEHFGISAEAARKMILRAMADIPRGDTEELKSTELAKLDQVEERYWEIVEAVHPYVAPSGKLVYADGSPLEDDSPVMAALAGIVKVSQHRSRLLGLNAPVKAQMEVFNFDSDSIEYQVRLLEHILDSGGRVEGVVDQAPSPSSPVTA